MNNNIYLFTNPKHSGKTSRLQQWISTQQNVHGILSPDINGKRNFMDIASGVTFEMEAKEIEKNTLTVGKYIFSKVAFNRAKIILMHAPLSEDGWLVIDEIGPLELKGEGFSETLKSILQFLGRKIKILLVVRDTLSEEVKTYFEIPEAEEILIS